MTPDDGSVPAASPATDEEAEAAAAAMLLGLGTDGAQPDDAAAAAAEPDNLGGGVDEDGNPLPAQAAEGGDVAAAEAAPEVVPAGDADEMPEWCRYFGCVGVDLEADAALRAGEDPALHSAAAAAAAAAADAAGRSPDGSAPTPTDEAAAKEAAAAADVAAIAAEDADAVAAAATAAPATEETPPAAAEEAAPASEDAPPGDAPYSEVVSEGVAEVPTPPADPAADPAAAAAVEEAPLPALMEAEVEGISNDARIVMLGPRVKQILQQSYYAASEHGSVHAALMEKEVVVNMAALSAYEIVYLTSPEGYDSFIKTNVAVVHARLVQQLGAVDTTARPIADAAAAPVAPVETPDAVEVDPSHAEVPETVPETRADDADAAAAIAAEQAAAAAASDAAASNAAASDAAAAATAAPATEETPPATPEGEAAAAGLPGRPLPMKVTMQTLMPDENSADCDMGCEAEFIHGCIRKLLDAGGAIGVENTPLQMTAFETCLVHLRSGSDEYVLESGLGREKREERWGK
jgi:hypothetical protein